MRVRRGYALALSASLIACFAGGCSSGGVLGSGPGAADDGGGDVVTTSPDDGGIDATQPVSQVVGAAGGTVTASGVTLTVPPGALTTPTAITIEPSATVPPAGYTALSPVFTVGPVGTVLLKPVTVDITLTTPTTDATVFLSNGSGGFDGLVTSVTGSVASASVSHLGDCFAARAATSSEAGGGPDATGADAATTDAGSAADAVDPADTGAGSEAGPVVEGGATQDSGAADSGGADSGATDSGAAAEAAASEASAPDGAVADGAATEAGSSDAGDAGFNGISATVAGVATSFIYGASTVDVNSIWRMQADDSASTTHWTLQLDFPMIQQNSCSPGNGYPVIYYTHYTAGVMDTQYATSQIQGYCLVSFFAWPTSVGTDAHGQFSATLTRATDAGGGSVSVSSGSFNILY